MRLLLPLFYSFDITMNSQDPILPPLYFLDKAGTLILETETSLPLELLGCVSEYCDFGDLAKLACVQHTWSTILYDAVSASEQAKWKLAQALEHGTHGLETHARKALELYVDLSNVTVRAADAEKATTLVPVVVLEPKDHSKKCFAPAMKCIANCYLTGVGVAEADAITGLSWLEASFTLGHDADAAHEVAIIYEYGTYGVEIDVVKAAEWFEKAAEAGHIEAMAELALCYELGCGVEQSDEKALDWYTAAANKGHLTAKFSIGEAYEEARGVPQSDEEACLWYYKAAVEGDEDSRKALRRLEAVARIVVPGASALLDG